MTDRPPTSRPARTASAARRKPVQERSQDTVQRIFQATTRLLETMPVDEITTSRIALAAGVSIGALYRFFPDKQAIVDAITLRYLEEFQGILGGALAAAQPSAGPALIELVIDTFVAFTDARPDFRSLSFGGHVSAEARDPEVGPDSMIVGLTKRFIMDFLCTPVSPELDLKLRVAAEAGDRLLTYAYKQPPEARAEIIGQMKRLVCGYLFG